MQKAMQEDCAVFRTGETLAQGVKRIAEVHAGIPDISIQDRGLIWNTDLVETLEFDNLIVQAADDWEAGRFTPVPDESEFIPLPERHFTR